MKSHNASARRFRPTLESLEDRLTPTTLPAGFSETTLASGITGTVVYVDKGYHSMGMGYEPFAHLSS